MGTGTSKNPDSSSHGSGEREENLDHCGGQLYVSLKMENNKKLSYGLLESIHFAISWMLIDLVVSKTCRFRVVGGCGLSPLWLITAVMVDKAAIPARADFFRADNPEGIEARNEVVALAMADMISWMQEGGQVGIFDATNSTRKRRNMLMKLAEGNCKRMTTIFLSDQPSAQPSECTAAQFESNPFFWLQSKQWNHYKEDPMFFIVTLLCQGDICDLFRLSLCYTIAPEGYPLLNLNKQNMEPAAVSKDIRLLYFWKQFAMMSTSLKGIFVLEFNPDYAEEYICLLKSLHCCPLVYEPVEEGSYIKMIDMASGQNGQIQVNNISGHLPGRIVFFLDTHLTPRPILLTRHGESRDNVRSRIGGDTVLSEAGELYSKKLANFVEKRLKSECAASIWTSTLQRTILTASPIVGFPKIQWRVLDEINAGVCDGMTYEEIKKNMPEEYESRKKDKLRYRYPRGESYPDAVLRALYAYFADRPLKEIPHIKFPLRLASFSVLGSFFHSKSPPTLAHPTNQTMLNPPPDSSSAKKKTNSFNHKLESIFSYDGNIMLAAIISLLVVILLILLLHLYAKCFLAQSHNRRRRSVSVSYVLNPSRFHHFHTFTLDSTTSSRNFSSYPTKGLDASIISSIPLFVYKSREQKQDLECVICLSMFEDKDVGRDLPKCGHAFHVECIDMWLHSHSNCPICRAPVVLDSTTKVVPVNSSADVDGDLPEMVLDELDLMNGSFSAPSDVTIEVVDSSTNVVTADDLSSRSSLSSSSLGDALRRMLSSNRSERGFSIIRY
ncbi:6-phosphofructo-2-kinase [Dillenia turbinata]|uniref:6-phosphofructo-2-kinase n=1 Tax=Dillenia turbinata TaxID=194707 RepID=A0AAN8VGN4_9MAGN